jgi:hypothetical protein
VRQGPDGARFEQHRNFPQQRAGKRRAMPGQLIDVEGEIGHILPKRPHMQAAIDIKVAFAEFEETAERL